MQLWHKLINTQAYTQGSVIERPLVSGFYTSWLCEVASSSSFNGVISKLILCLDWTCVEYLLFRL
jgi:hypothetical protein